MSFPTNEECKGGINIDNRAFAQSCSTITGLTQKQINNVLDCYLSYIKNNLINGNDVLISGIGKISPVERKINEHTDPITKQKHCEKKYKSIHLKILPSFKKELNKSLGNA